MTITTIILMVLQHISTWALIVYSIVNNKKEHDASTYANQLLDKIMVINNNINSPKEESKQHDNNNEAKFD